MQCFACLLVGVVVGEQRGSTESSQLPTGRHSHAWHHRYCQFIVQACPLLAPAQRQLYAQAQEKP